MDVQRKAQEARACFEQAQRVDGAPYWRVRDGSPDWVADLVRAAHGTDADGTPSMLPDDYRYAYCVEALDALIEHEDVDTARGSIEADVYISDLTAWLGSHTWRRSYCDEAVEEWGFEGIAPAMTLGQLAEKQEVFDLMISFLHAQD